RVKPMPIFWLPCPGKRNARILQRRCLMKNHKPSRQHHQVDRIVKRMIKGQCEVLSKVKFPIPMVRNLALQAIVVQSSGGWDMKRITFGKYNQTKESRMSRNKSLRTRGVLTLGVAAFALCVGAAPTMAGGHEGRGGGIGGARVGR